MNENEKLVDAIEFTARRLRDAVMRDDREDIVRIVNALDLKEARMLVGGLAHIAFGGDWL